MARNRTPTSILDAKGSFLTHKNRLRPDEPVTVKPLGNPPAYLSKEEKKVWKETVKEAAPGVLFESDRTAFELLVRLKSKMIHEYSSMMAADKAQLVSLCSRFAMTPADRSKVSVNKPAQSSLQQFLNRKSATSANPAVATIQ